MMRLPTRGRTDADALGLGHSGGVSDERIEVSILGPLAGLSISNESEGGFEVGRNLDWPVWMMPCSSFW